MMLAPIVLPGIGVGRLTDKYKIGVTEYLVLYIVVLVFIMQPTKLTVASFWLEGRAIGMLRTYWLLRVRACANCFC